MKVTKENFSAAIKILGSRSAGFKSVMGDVMAFAHEQATSNSNSSPLMVVRENLPNWVKPSGCTVKRLDEFVRDFCGFEWNKETKSYKKIPGANLRELPEQGAKFWDHAQEEQERKPKMTARHRLILAVKAWGDEGLFEEDLLEALPAIIAEAKLASKGELAATLGLAA